MPRYLFSWDNLSAGLLDELGRDLALRDPVAAALRARYGARPKPDFVRDAWPTLLRTWLTTEGPSRQSIVAGLQARNLGSTGLAVDSPTAQLEYLKSCRNSTSLREVVVGAFTAFGESKTIRTPVPVQTAGHSDAPAERPPTVPANGPAAQPRPGRYSGADVTSLDDWLGRAVAEILGDNEAARDEDGDIPVRRGSTICYVRAVGDPPSVRLFAPMVVDVPRTPALLEAINDINGQIAVGRVFHTPAGEVLFVIELYDEQLTTEILRASLDAATFLADRFDHELQARFGGRTMFAETTDDSVLV